MSGVFLAIFCICWSVNLQGGSLAGTLVASPEAFSETARQANTAIVTEWTFDSWGSKARSQSGGFSTTSPHVEPQRARLSNITSCSYHGLALQEVPDSSANYEGALCEMRSALEQSVAEQGAEVSRTISQQAQAGCRRSRHSRGRADRLCRQDPMGGNYAQLKGESGDNTTCKRSGKSAGGGSWSASARTCSSSASPSGGHNEDPRASTWTAADDGHASLRVGTQASRLGREAQFDRDKAKSWPPQQDGQGAAPDHGFVREDYQTGSGLAGFCGAGGGTIQKAQSVVPSHPSRACQVSYAKDPGARTDQGRDHQGLTDFGELRLGSGRASGGDGRCSSSGLSTRGSSAPGHDRRVRGYGGRHGTRHYTTSRGAGLFQESGCHFTYQGCQGAPQGEGADQEGCEDWLGLTMVDQLPFEQHIPVNCVVEHVFAGVWSWIQAHDELHYPKDNLDLRSGADGCDSLSGGDGFPPRRVRFNPQVEIIYVDDDNGSSLFSVDEILPPVELFHGVEHSSDDEAFDDEAVLNTDLDPPDLVEDDQADEEEDDAYVIFNNFRVLLDSTQGTIISDLEPLRVITYGIRGHSLGRRDTWVTMATLPHVRQAIWHLWEDAIPQFAACFAFAVTPQPLRELQVTKAWIVLVEIDPGASTPQNHCPILSMTFSTATGLIGNPHPRLVAEQSNSQQLVPLHLHSQYCLPVGMRVCNLEVAGDMKTPHEDFVIRPGSLSKLLFGEPPPDICRARQWFPDVEEVALEMASQRGTAVSHFQFVIHSVDATPRTFDVDATAVTNPLALRQGLPLDIRRGRLFWVPLGLLHPSAGIRPGQFHFVLGSPLRGPSRPLLVFICRSTAAYQEFWSHAVHWVDYGTSPGDMVARLFPDDDESFRSSVVLSSNHAVLGTLEHHHSGSVVIAFVGRSMSSEGLVADPSADSINLMQMSASLRDTPLAPTTAGTGHMVLQWHHLPQRRLSTVSCHFQRRSLFLLAQDGYKHVLVSWASPRVPLWDQESPLVDILIAHPRAFDSVDIIVEFVGAHSRQTVQDPLILRLMASSTLQSVIWNVHRELHADGASQDGQPLLNGTPWPLPPDQRIDLCDGDVVTFFVQGRQQDHDLCLDASPTSSTFTSESPVCEEDLQLVTILQSERDGVDQRFDMLVSWFEPLPATLQRCISYALVGWALPCHIHRRPWWQHTKQVLAIAWLDLIPIHRVPVLLVEISNYDDIDRHVVYLPVELRIDDLHHWMRHSGHFEIIDGFRYDHPRDPNTLCFAAGMPLFVRYNDKHDTVVDESTDDLQLLQTWAVNDHTTLSWMDPTSVIAEPYPPPQHEGPADVEAGYTEANLDLSSGPASTLLDTVFDDVMLLQLKARLLEPSHVISDPDSLLTSGYTEDNSDLSSGHLSETNAEPPHLIVDDRIDSLRLILVDLANDWPSGSFATCYDLVPNLHPIAQLICASQDWTPLSGLSVRYHIYTDGSARRGPGPCAAWAFHVLVESATLDGPVFHRLGYTGALVDTTLWPSQCDSLDAEAFAIIYLADWLLSLPCDVQCCVHFDATVVGCAAFGVQQIAAPAATPRDTQHFARVMMSLAQARHERIVWCHVKAHSGQPDNEIADSVAHAICMGWTPPFQPPSRLGELFAHPLRDWAWMEMSPTSELPDLDNILKLPVRPPQEDVSIWTIPSHVSEAQASYVTWKLGTANVRTMECAQQYHSDKVIFLREQLTSFAFDVFAFQECRGRFDQCLDDGDFIRICSAAMRGQGGLELWFRKHGAFLATGLGALTKDQLVVWHASDTILGVSCHHPAFTCTLAVIYGPQRGRGDPAIMQWWQDLVNILRGRPCVGPLVLLGDANAHLGSVLAEGIGGLAPEIEDAAGGALRELCNRFGLFIPSTFPAFHSGDSATFIGHWHMGSRVDYIGLPQEWSAGVTLSSTCPDFDLLTDGVDHVAVQVEMSLCVQPRVTIIPGRSGRYNRVQAQTPDGQALLMSLAQMLPEQPWECDVNDHWHEMRTDILNNCEKWFPKVKRQRRQHYMSDELWSIVEERKDFNNGLRQLRVAHARRALAGFFALWKKDLGVFRELQVQEILSDQVHALELMQYQCLTSRFHDLRKTDRKTWAAQCATSLQDGLSRSSFSQWFKLLKPKRAIHQKSRPHARLPGIRAADGSWMPAGTNVSLMWQRHFGRIENAEERSVPDVEPPSVDMLLATPTLYDLEKSIRLSQSGKAPGPDQIGSEIWKADAPGIARRCFPLFLKSGLRRQWVAEFAGGDLVPLHKKGDPSLPSNYRAILLEPTLGRIFSRAWRTRLVAALQMVQAPLQFGGHRQVSIEIAHLIVRNAQQISHARRQACAMIFADIRSAFYVVAKPFLTGEHTSPEALTDLFRYMGLPSDVLADFVEAVEEGVVIPEVDPSRHLQAVVASMLRHTWAKVPGSDRYMLPRTGSRPGDPLADTLFGFLMAKALRAIAVRFDLDGLATTWDGLSSITPAVVWVDDAIFHIEASAAQLQEKTICALRIIHEELLRCGLRLNYSHGKTEVLTCFWGRHSTRSAQHFYKMGGGQFRVWNEFDGVLQVRAVPHYKYLGGFLTRSLSLHPELKIRRAQMHQQLHGLKHCALSEATLPLEKRQALLQSLGFSVATLHAGTWRPLRQCEWHVWHGTTTAAYQYLHRRGQNGEVQHRSTLELAVAAHAPMPHALLYLRRLRVLTQLCRLGDGPVLDNVLCEHRHCGGSSWLSGLLEATAWARTTADTYDWLPSLDNLHLEQAWTDLQPLWWQVRKLVEKVERLHLQRNKMSHEIQQQKTQHDNLLLQQGWCGPPGVQDVIMTDNSVTCEVCGYKAASQASLGVHAFKKHGIKVAARRFAEGAGCPSCHRHFHTRPRVILHLQYGTTRCLVHALRHVTPLSVEDSDLLDRKDMTHGVALHQKGLRDAAAQYPFFEADEDLVGLDLAPGSAEEMQEWSKFGSLPSWLTGRERIARDVSRPVILDAIDELSACEKRWYAEATLWQAPPSEVPKPLSASKLYFLVFFSGHRRHRDLISWLEWSGMEVQPIPIDLAIDSFWGDARRGGLWADLIRDGRVAGGHFGPPCETYTDARWLEVVDEVWKRHPRPLRCEAFGWGMPQRGMRELQQLEVGNLLMWLSFGYMMLLAAAGGCATLEHPKGQAPACGRFSVWTSSLVKRMRQSPSWDVVTFLQGPLGVPYSKPTRLLSLRLPGLARALYGAYDPHWRPTEKLGGHDSNGGWRTTKAKEYPDKMNQVLSAVYLDYIRGAQRQGWHDDPDALRPALAALISFWDPYMDTLKGAFMASDYHG